MNVFDLSPKEFNQFLMEEAQYRSPAEIDDLRRRYRDANSVAGAIQRTLAPEEGRRRATYAPVDAPEGMSIWDAFKSGETSWAIPQSLVDLLSGGARAVESPAEYAQGIPPRADAKGDAMNLAGVLMLGGGAVAAPKGSVRSGFVRNIKEKYPDVEIDVYGSPDRGYELGKIKVPKDKQGSGLGTQVMNDLVEAADAEGARISLTPDTSFGGTSVSRLKDFYKRFGFVENKGKNKDFSTRNTMYRDPTAMANASKSAGALTVAADVAERGNTLIDMLKSGRAADITDNMLDMGDSVKNTQLNQYLFQNYDLPMDEASRMARAQEMGFNVNDVQYHGTAPSIYSDEKFSPDITAFRPSVKGQLGAGVYVTPDITKADKFARAIDVNKGDLDFNNKFIFKGGSVLPVYIRSPNPASLKEMRNAQYGLENVSGYRDLSARGTKALSDEGFTGVKDGNEENVFDPKNIRSINARFDPRLSHLSNLTAANASPLGGLVAQGMVTQEEIDDYLRQKGVR